MAYTASGDFSHISTEELEAMARRSANPAERQEISAELSRRYANMYRTPQTPPNAERSAQERTQSARQERGQGGWQERQGFSASGPGQVRHGPRFATPGSRPAQSPVNGVNQPVAGGGAFRINGLAICSLVLAVLWIFWWGSLAGIILGFMALRRIRARNQSGRLLAIAGIVIGSFAFLMTFFIIAVGGY
jgi:hypothetical protein